MRAWKISFETEVNLNPRTEFEMPMIRSALKMSGSQRREALRRRSDHVQGAVFLGWMGARLNRSNRFAYLSYVPDSIREYGALPEFRQVVDAWTRGNERKNAGDIGRMLLLEMNARRAIDEDIDGHFAELGVHKGHSARLLADVIAENPRGRRLFLFDTFGGFDERDLAGIDASVAPLFADTSVDAVKQRVRHEELCEYRPGYFPETAADMTEDTRFAFVHLDCDLYEPMRAALTFFYPRLSAGAYLVIHDYSSQHWPGTTRAVDEFLDGKPEKLTLMPDKSGTVIIRKH